MNELNAEVNGNVTKVPEDKEEGFKMQTQEQVKEILGHPPGWMLRWGISLIVCVVLIGLLLAWWIKFPDVMKAPVVLTAIAPPIEVVATTDGKLIEFQVQNQESVKANQVLGWIDNSTKLSEIEILESYLKNIETESSIKFYADLEILEVKTLGLLNSDYLQWKQSLLDLQFFLKRHAVFQKIRSLDNEISKITRLNGSIEKQKKLFQKEVDILRKDFNRHRQLKLDGNISDQEFEKMESQLIQQQRSLESMHSNLIHNEIRIEQLQSQIQELKTSRSEELKAKILLFQKQSDQLQMAIKNWKYQYLIIAPIDGQVIMNEIRVDQQFIKKGEVILTIVPLVEDKKIIARCKTPVSGIGKIGKGVKVNIRLDAYPYREYGVLQARVDHISLIPLSTDNQNDKYYALDIELPEQLRTTYGVEILFKHEMSGQAHIITEDRNILSRIFNQFQDILKNN